MLNIDDDELLIRKTMLKPKPDIRKINWSGFEAKFRLPNMLKNMYSELLVFGDSIACTRGMSDRIKTNRVQFALCEYEKIFAFSRGYIANR